MTDQKMISLPRGWFERLLALSTQAEAEVDGKMCWKTQQLIGYVSSVETILKTHDSL